MSARPMFRGLKAGLIAVSLFISSTVCARVVGADLGGASEGLSTIPGAITVAHTDGAGPDAVPRPLWEHLATFDQTMRENAVIELELGLGATARHEAAAASIVELWNTGQCAAALEALRALEEAGVPAAVGLAWKAPVPVDKGFGLGADVRIGSPNVGAAQVLVEGSEAFGTTFAAVRWQGWGATPGWSLNISYDYGASWSEVYYWHENTYNVVDIDMVELDNYTGTQGFVDVAFISEIAPDRVLVREFLADDGAYLMSRTWFEDTPQEKTDVAVDSYLWYSEGPPETWVPYLAAAVIQDNGVLRYFFGAGGEPTGVTDAVAGLDFCAGADNADHVHFAYASFIAADDRVHVWRQEDHHVAMFGTHSGDHQITNLTTLQYWHPPTLMCVYEESFTYGQGIRYTTSSDGGDSWFGQVLVEPEPGEHEYDMPAMPAHAWAVVYAQEGAANAYFRTYAWSVNRWSKPVPFNDHSCYFDAPLTIGLVPEAPGGESYSYGLGYLHRYFDPFPVVCPYFDRAPGPGGYCHARGEMNTSFIRRVIVGSIDVESSMTRYSDFWYYSTEVARGADAELTVVAENSEPSDECGVWVDWNQDLDFDDPGESIAVDGSPGAGPYAAHITPPLDAVLGETRMRIRVVRGETPPPCGGTDSGEVEDYTIEVADYCEASSGCGQYISRVEVAGIDNATDCDGYAFYHDLVADMQRNQPYLITITIANGYDGNFGGLWIDWNRDLDFFDDGEEIALSPPWGPGPYTATIVPPPDATLGQTRMRVRLHRETDWPWPCDDEPYGEVEDYVVNVVESPYCSAFSECDEYISRVQLGEIDNISECALGWYGYSDFTYLSTELAIGTDTPITITLDYGEEGDQGGLWIDWNQDLDFFDDGEAIPLDGSPGPGPYTAAVSPPPGAPLGATRMRVRVVRDHEPEPCGEQDAGEVEDYTIIVVEGQECPADFDDDGDVDTADLLYLLGAWGTPNGDVDGDGDTDTADLLALLAAWGECP
jgi:hypothetical protein